MAGVFVADGLTDILNLAFNCFQGIPVEEWTDKKCRFTGAGIYGLFYYGNMELYEKTKSAWEDDYPIYIGKAVPEGWRQGRAQDKETTVLWRRISKHFRSISAAKNLEIDEFRFRAMVMNDPESDLITAVENKLIRAYYPIWNSVLDGFGNNDPGSGRYNQAKSDWDVIHPGRGYAEKCTGIHNEEESIKSEISKWRRTL